RERPRGLAAFAPWHSPGTRATFDEVADPAGEAGLHTVNMGPGVALWKVRHPATPGLTYRVAARVATRDAAAVYLSGRFVTAEGKADTAPRSAVIRGTTDSRIAVVEFAAPS